jgi:hypothetical protein
MRPIIFVLSLLWCSAATAAEPNAVEDARRLYLAGRQAYEAGRLDVAAASFEAAYRLDPRPALMWNLGQAYRRQFLLQQRVELLRRAVDSYRRYLLDSPTGENRDEADRLLAELSPLLFRLQPDSLGATSTPPSTNKAKTELMVVAEAAKASIRLDDNPAGPAPLLAEVRPGDHRAHVEAPGYFPTEMHVVAVADRLVTAEARLLPRPGRIELHGPAGARLFVDQQARGRLPQAAFELPAGEHALALVARGRAPWVAPLAVARGATLELSATLVPSAQRRAARWVAVSAGVAAALAVAFGGTWLEAQVAASRLNDKRVSSQLTSDELAAYDSDKTRRDQFRIATAAAISLTGALALVAAGLYYLDNPTLPEPGRR